MRICHFTSAHTGNDPRIFFRQCVALAEQGHDVFLVAPGENERVRQNVQLLGIPKPKGRLARLFITPWALFVKVRRLKADIYHFHDPELLPVGLALKLFGKHVIYDIHENFPMQILEKSWIAKPVRALLAMTFDRWERFVAYCLDGLVIANPATSKRFASRRFEIVRNLPKIEENMVADPTPYRQRPMEVTYVGGMSTVRGTVQLVEAIDIVLKTHDVTLNMVGTFREKGLEEKVTAMPGWRCAKYWGWQDNNEVMRILNRSRVGMANMWNTPHHRQCYQFKIFEYMTQAIPIVSSDYETLREVIGGCNCGVFIDPMSPQQIAEAIVWILDNEAKAEEMGLNGFKAVGQQYTWKTEMPKLLKLYEAVM